jgi:CHAT domain-containing protein
MFLGGLSEAVQGYPELANVSLELEGVHKLYGGKLLQDNEFVIPNVKTELENSSYNSVHIATHAEFSGDVRDTFLLTWDGKLTMDDLDQYLWVNRFNTDP